MPAAIGSGVGVRDANTPRKFRPLPQLVKFSLSSGLEGVARGRNRAAVLAERLIRDQIAQPMFL
jgi:hypothetical protein